MTNKRKNKIGGILIDNHIGTNRWFCGRNRRHRGVILNGLKKLIQEEMKKVESWTRRQQEDIESMKRITESLINAIRVVLRAVEHSEYGLEAHKELEQLEKTVVGLSVKGKSGMES